MLNKFYSFFAEVGLKRSIMVFFCITLAIITISMCSFFFVIFQNEIANEEKSNIKQTLTQVNRNIVYTIDFYEKILYYLSVNSHLKEQLKIYGKDPYSTFSSVMEINRLLEPFKSANPNIRKIEIYLEDSDLVDNELFFSKENAWYISMLKNPPNHTEIKFCKGKVFTLHGIQSTEDVLQISRQIYDTVGGRVVGVMSMYISMQEISSLINGFNASSGGITIIEDSDKNIIYKSADYKPYLLSLLDDSFFQETKQETTRKINNEKWWILSNSQQKGNIYVIAFVNTRLLKQKVNQLRVVIAGVVMGLVILALFFSFVLSGFITKGLDNLIGKIKRISAGEYNLSDEMNKISYKGEIGYLHLQFDNMTKKINTLINDVYQEKIKRRDNEIKLLQSQINSHFLYNTLSSINWMAINVSAFDISHAVNALAKYYRITLSKGNEIIPVFQEIEHVKNYIIIQKLRFKDRFEAVYEINENIVNYYTPKIILQPFVENAIIHGFDCIEYQGKITLRAYRKEDYLEFIIEDNGSGLQEASSLQEDNVQIQNSGYGIRYVDEKIKLLYGDDFGISIKNGDKNGVVVTIHIPVIESLQ